MKYLTKQYDVVVCGGGLAGYCAAIASARQGTKTALVQDRPVFGGNSSSEVRVTPHGACAFHAYARETGIISEVLIEERARNHEEIFENGWTNNVYDLVLYDLAMETPNLEFFLNTSVQAVKKSHERQIESVVGYVGNAETQITFESKIFIDCTGDGTIAALARCQSRMGSEAKEEFDEYHAPKKANLETMGSSIHFKTKNMGKPVPFKAPEWAVKHENPEYFYNEGRIPKNLNGGYWWLEIGIPWDTIHDNETIRHELLRHTLGVWDWIKNCDPELKEKAQNYALDWVGQVPGKRESRRIIGRYFMTEHDPQNKTVFHDEIAFGGWFIDLHTPGGLLASSSEPLSAVEYDQLTDYSIKSYAGPYGIPLRILIANDVDNLMMAGRNVSTSHAALGTVRVMGTTALMGQAAGVAAATALERSIDIGRVPEEAMGQVQQTLLRSGCFLPNAKNQDPLDLARKATVSASSDALVYGVGPQDVGFHNGLSYWKDQPQENREFLLFRRGQLIALQTDHLHAISVCLSNTSGEPQAVQGSLIPASDIWDYRADTLPLAQTTLMVPEGKLQWIQWDLQLSAQNGLKPGTFVRLDLDKNPNVRWHPAGMILPGHMAMYEMGQKRMRRYSHGVTMSFQVEPAQRPFAVENVISGVTRPHQFTNLWRSDPQQPLPQYLELEWEQPQTIQQVELTFPGHLIREYHAYGPFYKDPQCAKDYSLQAWVDSRWKEILEVEDNYQRHRIHQLEAAIATSRLRIVIRSTNGDPSAAIYEVRCYGESHQ